MRLVYIFVALTSVTLLAGCILKSKDYFPLTEGMEWSYAVEYTVPGLTVQKGKIVLRSDGTKTIAGKVYHRITTIAQGIPGADTKPHYYRISPEGVLFQEGDMEQIYLPYPAEVGKSWSTTTSDSNLTYTIEGIETAELIDRKYENCLKISFEGDRTVANRPFGGGTVHISGVTYRAPGIGEVKTDLKVVNMGMTTHIATVLENFKQ